MGDLVGEFCTITGASTSVAVSFLESADFNLETALSNFFETGGAIDEPAVAAVHPPSSASSQAGPGGPGAMHTAPYTGPRTLSGAPAPVSSAPAPAASQPKKPAARPAAGRIHSLSSYQNNDDDDDEEEGGKPENYFAGGGDRSGVAIQGPPGAGRGNESAADRMTRELFEKARQQGAKDAYADREEQEKSASASSAPKSFGGAGYRLGHTPDMPKLPAEGTVPKQQQQPEPEKPKVLKIFLTFYKNGVVVRRGEQGQDEPLRRVDDPAQQEFLGSLTRGQVPQEFRTREYAGVQIEFNLIDRKGEEYVAPKPQFQAFVGSGRALGVEQQPPVVAAASRSSSSSSSSASSVAAPVAQFKVDESLPVTSIQIRLADGTRLVSKFNQNVHTVNDLRRFVEQAVPVAQRRPFDLISGFPQKVVQPSDNTLEAEGLSGAVVVQKLK